MSGLKQLTPGQLWRYFEEICSIPRISKHEEKIRKYLLAFAAANNLEAREDKVGNILIIRPATPGFENKRTIVLQSHMDMVGEKNADTVHDWHNDPIKPVIRNGWVCAEGTTLGADDGIGIAAQMAILTDKNLAAGKIECLFTVDEESGMTGAVNLDPEFFEGRILINLDSEDEGIIYIGCAGGIDTLGVMKYSSGKVAEGSEAFEISVTGLHGGHSGDEIHKGYGNSIKIMARLLQILHQQYNISLAKFDGGNLRNAIPREAFSTITANSLFGIEIQKSVKEFYSVLKNEFGALEPDLKIAVKQANMPAEVLDNDSLSKLLNSLIVCPHGVISWSKDMEDLVETSSNLAVVKFGQGNTVNIITTQRSSIESAKHEASGMVQACLKLAGAEVTTSEGYPGWKPNPSSEILAITKVSYKKLFGTEPKVRAIHAGLECGLIYEKDKSMDMISIGPTIRGAHTPEEMIQIDTADKFWNLLIEILRNTQ